MIAAAYFPGARQLQITINRKSAQGKGKTGEHITKAGKIASGSFSEDHSAGAAACTGTDGLSFKDGDGFCGIEVAQPCGGRKTAETTTHYGDIDLLRHEARRRMEIDRPRRLAPA